VIIENTRFGSIEIGDEKIITMIRSLPGFPGKKRFVILDRKESHPFLWYQCVDDPALALVLLNPNLFKSDYAVDLKAAVSGIPWDDEAEEDIAVFVVVNASSGKPEKMTANLMAPILVNTKRFEAAQMIFQNSPYPHNFPIFSADNK